METQSSETEEKKPEAEKDVGFKKPILLVGKLGRCPKRLTTPATNNKKQEVEEEKEPTTEDHAKQSVEEPVSSDLQSEFGYSLESLAVLLLNYLQQLIQLMRNLLIVPSIKNLNGVDFLCRLTKITH